MRFYHRTTDGAARAILADGFKDSEGYYMTADLTSGVWLSDRPLTCNEGAKGNILLRVEIPAQAVKEYEWVENEVWRDGVWVLADEEDRKPYREWQVPARLVNRYRRTLQVIDDLRDGPMRPVRDVEAYLRKWEAIDDERNRQREECRRLERPER